MFKIVDMSRNVTYTEYMIFNMRSEAMENIRREKLIELRKALGYTQKEVARYLGKSRNAYTQYETGKSNPSFEDIIKLKKLFKNASDDIFLSKNVKKCDGASSSD